MVSSRPMRAGDLDLGAHAVGAGHQHGVLEARQAHGAAEPAEAAEDERVLRALQPLLHELDGAVARLDVDAGLLVREPLVLGHARSPFGYPPSLRPASARHPVPEAVSRGPGAAYHPGMELRGMSRRRATAALARRGRRRAPAPRRSRRVRGACAGAGRGSRPPPPASAPPAPASYDRTVKVDLVERLPEPPELVIFGGSRAQRFEPSVAEKLTGLPAFNFAVQNSRPEDAYAMSRATSSGARPA